MESGILCGCGCGRSVGRSSEEESRAEEDSGDVGEPDPTLPCTEDVILKTEQVTKNIQELLRAAQEFKHDRWELHPNTQSQNRKGICE